MEEHRRSPSPNRSSLPPPLHRHLRSAPQSLRRMSTVVAPHSPTPWSGGQRSTTDPAFYTYPPPPNSLRELVFPPSENQQTETTHGWPIDVPQPDVPVWDERFPHPQRIGHAESYTRADYSSWGGSPPSPRKANSSDWRPVSLGQYESHPRFSFGPETLRSQRVLAEPSSSRLSFIPYVAEPEGLSAQVYERPNLNASVTVEPAHEQAYLQSATSHGLPEISSADDFVSPLLDSVFLDVPGPSTTIDGSSSDAGQGDPLEERPVKTSRKGKQRANGPPEGGLTPLRRFRKKTEIACNFCRGRKLGCSGERPRCKTCIKRGGECAYEATARRRGPGKAPRGSRKLAKARGAGAPAERLTPESGRPTSTFSGISFEMPSPPIQTRRTEIFNPPPVNGEESEDHRWRANSIDRAFLTSFSSPGWGVT